MDANDISKDIEHLNLKPWPSPLGQAKANIAAALAQRDRGPGPDLVQMNVHLEPDAIAKLDRLIDRLGLTKRDVVALAIQSLEALVEEEA